MSIARSSRRNLHGHVAISVLRHDARMIRSAVEIQAINDHCMYKPGLTYSWIRRTDLRNLAVHDDCMRAKKVKYPSDHVGSDQHTVESALIAIHDDCMHANEVRYPSDLHACGRICIAIHDDCMHAKKVRYLSDRSCMR